MTQTLGKYLSSLLDAQNMSQLDFLDAIDMPRTTWNRKKNGDSGFTVDELVRISDTLKVSVQDIIDGQKYNSNGEIVPRWAMEVLQVAESVREIFQSANMNMSQKIVEKSLRVTPQEVDELQAWHKKKEELTDDLEENPSQ